MNGWTFDVVARRTANVLDRRSVFGVLIGAALAGGSLLRSVGAKDSNKETKKVRKMCKRDWGDCKAYSIGYCDQWYDPPESEACKADTLHCCKFYKKCSKKDYRKGNACARAITW